MKESAVQIAEDRESIARCFPVMSQLRTALTETEFIERVQLQQQEGYRLAYLEHEGVIVALGGFRIINVLWSGKTLYVDDLITNTASRSLGFGGRMIRWLENHARTQDCKTFALDSGTHRHQAHAFYFREGLRISDFHFQKTL